MAQEVEWSIVTTPQPTWEVLKQGIPQISSEPPLERETEDRFRPSTTGFPSPISARVEEGETEYKTRLAGQYGFQVEPTEQDEMSLLSEGVTMASEIEKLPSYLNLTSGSPEDMQRIVDKVFKGAGELAFHEGYGDYVVKLVDGRVIPFNKPGLTLEEARIPAQTLAAEVGGGAAGMAGGPVTAAVGAGLGAGFAKIKQLQSGKEFDFHDMSDSEILAEGAIESLIAFGADIVLAGGGVVIRRMMGNPAAKRFLGELTEDQIDEAIKIFDEKAAAIEARTGVRPEATTGQVMAGVDPETGRAIQSFEAGLEKTGEDVGKAARASQLEAEEALKTTMFGGEAAEDLTKAVPTGEAIQETAERGIMAQKEAIAQSSLDEQAEAITKQLDIVDVPPTAQTADEIRTYLKSSRDKVLGPEGSLSQEYNKFWEQIPDTIVDLKPVRDVGKKWSGVVNSDIFKTLTDENKSIINDALKAGAGRPRLGGTTALIETPETASMDQVTRALSLLKAEQRTLKTAPHAAKAREMAVLNDLVTEVQKARDLALKDVDPALRDQIYALDEAYAVAKEKIDGSLINRLISKKRGGGMKISDDKVMDAVLRNPAEARNIASLMRNPDYAGFNGTSTFKNGALGVYRDKVIDGTMTHKSFMNQYGASLEEIFTPNEMKKFSSLNKATVSIKLAERREKSLLDNVNKSFEMKLTGYDPERILDEVSGSPSKTKKLMEMLKYEPDKLADYRALRSRKLLNELESTDDLGNPTIDFKKIDSVLQKDQGELKMLYGDEFVTDMKLLKDITKMRMVPKQITTEMTNLLKETPPASAPVLFWRSTVARPLSRMGLLTTGALKLDRGAARKATAKLLQNPKEMQRAMNLYRSNAPLKKWIGLMEDIGAIELARHFREAEDKENVK